MQNRGEFFIGVLSVFQIFLITFVIFSFAFLISQDNTVSAQSPQILPIGNIGNWASDAETGELFFRGNRTGYFNTGWPGLPEGTPTLDTTTGVVGKVGAPPGEPPGLLGNIFGDTPFGTSGLGASLVSGLIYGGIAYGVGYLIGSLLGLDDNTVSAASAALGIG